ncbi:hypothetical protein [Lactobacillus intestinalis]|uniref:hypothetical protein n=1 Tax=Lactobacillus intestinalis TaxID=151781 RepID=UPI0026EC5EE8|nr:hypothetical protein [Lactobacillus intestinalis]
MADETQVTSVAGENATQVQATDSVASQEETLKKQFPQLAGFVYISDPDATIALWRHKAVPVFEGEDLSTLPWHVYKERPDDSLVDPVYKVDEGGWVENDKNAQTQILARAQAKLAELDKKSAELDAANDRADQALKSMQQLQAQSSQQNVAFMKSFTEQTQNTNKMLAAMQQTLATVVKAMPTTTQPAQNTDTKQENGGN